MATIALVTCRKLPDLSAEDQALRAALEDRGFTVRATIWDDPAVDWAGFALVVIRTAWDYHYSPAAFRAWLDHLEARGVNLWNPAPLVRWNMDKRYLLDLAERGVPIVPTVCLDQGAAANLRQMLIEQGWDEAVIKPRISATAWQTWRVSQATATADEARFQTQLALGGLLVQPFMDAIRTEGEWSLVFICGTFSHAVRKTPQAGDFRVQRDFGGAVSAATPNNALALAALTAIIKMRSPYLYARVDGVVEQGVFRLMELELIEPELYLLGNPHAIAWLADGIAHRITAFA